MRVKMTFAVLALAALALALPASSPPMDPR